jgi:hypothetical protein
MNPTIMPLSISELVILVCYLMFLIYRYAARDVPLYAKFIVLVAWLLSFGLIIVLPLDVYDTNNDDGLKVDVVWATLYWVNFCLSW